MHMNRNKKRILKITANEILRNGINKFTFQNLSNNTGLSNRMLHAYFPLGEKELILDAIEYMAQTWMDDIEKKIISEPELEQKIQILITGYAMGTDFFPQSLSTYIDLWHEIKNSEDKYTKQRLAFIYSLYINHFIGLVKDYLKLTNITEPMLKAFATIMTGLSDGIHIQSLISKENISFIDLRKVINQISLQFLLGEKHE